MLTVMHGHGQRQIFVDQQQLRCSDKICENCTGGEEKQKKIQKRRENLKINYQRTDEDDIGMS